MSIPENSKRLTIRSASDYRNPYDLPRKFSLERVFAKLTNVKLTDFRPLSFIRLFITNAQKWPLIVDALIRYRYNAQP